MPLFWILATVMTGLGLAFVVVPLLRARRVSGPTRKEANLEVLRGQRREIEADIERGVLPADARDEALATLVARADADLAPESAVDISAPRRSWIAAAAAAILIPAVSFGFYLAIGMPGAADPRNVATREESKPTDPQILAMVESLAKKVQERPDDVQGWSLLARSMAALGRYPEAARAYEHLAKIAPGDPQVLADLADALGMAQGRSLAGRPYEAAKAALQIDPKHRKSLALAGTAAMEAGDFANAARYWQALAAETPAGSEDEKRVRAILEEVRTRASGPTATRHRDRTAGAQARRSAAGSRERHERRRLGDDRAGSRRQGRRDRHPFRLRARRERQPHSARSAARHGAAAADDILARRQHGDVAAGEALPGGRGAHRGAHHA